ncbi:MAG: DUF1289 domain-containing protein [Proteobacteria bacterium]|nr:DUF1289 domain-containing protein [Pseudomonadota bacterium]
MTEKYSTSTIASPCISNCCLNEEDVCVGCFRSLPEIVGWVDADDTVRQVILNNTAPRRTDYYERYWQSGS